MEGHVSVEPLTSIVRFHPGGEGYGSPYTFSCVLTVIGTEGYLSAGGGKMTPQVFREIKKALFEGLGLTSVEYERRSSGKHRLRRVT